MKKLIKKLAPEDKERYLSIWFILHVVEDVSIVGLPNFLTNHPERINWCRLFPVFVLSSLVMTS